jgi:hypothetical protein
MSQIFQIPIPKNVFIDFLKENCNRNSVYYTFSKVDFKKIKFKIEILEDFFKKIKPYYFKSKLFYLERDKTYKNFITVLRQICKFHAIPYTSKIVYSKSTYEIKYFIYHN